VRTAVFDASLANPVARPTDFSQPEHDLFPVDVKPRLPGLPGFSGAFTYTEVTNFGTSASAYAMVPVDAKHVALSWLAADGTAGNAQYGSILSCAP
jgi:hypothetical protein